MGQCSSNHTPFPRGNHCTEPSVSPEVYSISDPTPEVNPLPPSETVNDVVDSAPKPTDVNNVEVSSEIVEEQNLIIREVPSVSSDIATLDSDSD